MSALMLVKYRDEFIADFARRKATLVQTVRTDSQDRGGQTVFLIGGDGGRTTVTRGANNLIPPSDDAQSNITLDFNEDHDYAQKTSFNIFTAQGNQLDLMRMNSLAVIHRKQDDRIIKALETGTVSLGAVGTMGKSVANRIAAILGNADVGTDDGGMSLFCALTPAAWVYMTDITAFANADYVNFGGQTPVEEGLPQIGRFKHWMGVNWCEHGGLTGKGTNAATCLAWHKNAIGYSTSTRGIDAAIGYHSEQDYSWRRASIFHGAVKLFNSAIIKFTHDDTALSA